MPRVLAENGSRVSLRIPPDEKAVLVRAVALQQTTLTDFVLRNALAAAKTVIDQSERLKLSERDSSYVLELLETPPAPNSKLMQAACALPKQP
ncbi:DUF1778 domain-containing protein [Desulfurivibrio sp. D14AmB]|uniref:type II toxin-antitoxin system TacA family antitoxin n=1 Tax=Desulfurivibrio sp. D14AmB TaxID=3374370 RepID=UPI00376ED94B